MKTKTNIKSGALTANHSQTLRIKSNVKAGALTVNHSQSINGNVLAALLVKKLSTRTGVRAGGGAHGSTSSNHNQTLPIKSNIKSGGLAANHNQA